MINWLLVPFGAGKNHAPHTQALVKLAGKQNVPRPTDGVVATVAVRTGLKLNFCFGSVLIARLLSRRLRQCSWSPL